MLQLIIPTRESFVNIEDLNEFYEILNEDKEYSSINSITESYEPQKIFELVLYSEKYNKKFKIKLDGNFKIKAIISKKKKDINISLIYKLYIIEDIQIFGNFKGEDTYWKLIHISFSTKEQSRYINTKENKMILIYPASSMECGIYLGVNEENARRNKK